MAAPFLVFRITGQQRLTFTHKIIDEFVKIVLPGGVVCRLKSSCFVEQVTSECGVQWRPEPLGNSHGRSAKTNSGSHSRLLASSALGRQAILSTNTIQVYFVSRLSDTHAPQRQVGDFRRPLVHRLEPLVHRLEPLVHRLEPLVHRLEPLVHRLEIVVSGSR